MLPPGICHRGSAGGRLSKCCAVRMLSAVRGGCGQLFYRHARVSALALQVRFSISVIAEVKAVKDSFLPVCPFLSFFFFPCGESEKTAAVAVKAAARMRIIWCRE